MDGQELTEKERIENEAYETEIITACQNEALRNNEYHRRFCLHSFVSKSKGYGRKRNVEQEITLLQDRHNPIDVGFHLLHRIAVDEMAGEMVSDRSLAFDGKISNGYSKSREQIFLDNLWRYANRR